MPPDSTFPPIPSMPERSFAVPKPAPDLVQAPEPAEETAEHESSIGDAKDWSDSSGEGQRLHHAALEPGVRVLALTDAEVERMEYHDLTFDEAVRVLTPKGRPTLWPDFLILPMFKKDQFRCAIDRKSQKPRRSPVERVCRRGTSAGRWKKLLL
jgi:hypothetical protein